jgi:hypothetical protein
MTSTNFSQTIIGEATQDAVGSLANLVRKQAATFMPYPHEIEASVALISKKTLTITAGAEDGVVPGDVFEVFSVSRNIKDPETGAVIRRRAEKVGELTIGEVQSRTASGTYVGFDPA